MRGRVPHHGVRSPRDAEAGAGIAKGRQRWRMLCCSISAASRHSRAQLPEQQLPQALLQPGTAAGAVVGGWRLCWGKRKPEPSSVK